MGRSAGAAEFQAGAVTQGIREAGRDKETDSLLEPPKAAPHSQRPDLGVCILQDDKVKRLSPSTKAPNIWRFITRALGNPMHKLLGSH